MATINEFKLIKRKSYKRYGFIKSISKEIKDDLLKEKIGFYHLVLEGISGVINNEDNKYMIIDTEYNKYVNGKSVNDLGMDAISITESMYDNEKNYDIKLFNFKYRSKFNPDKTKSEGDISRSTKFLEYIVNREKLEDEDDVVHQQVNKVIDCLNSNTICNITLYMVSNEAKGFETDSNEYIKILEKSYGMQIKNISLDEIVSFFDVKKKEHSSMFVLDPKDFLSFESDQKSTQKSYIIKISLLDLIRITCDNATLNKSYRLVDDNMIKGETLDFTLLYDNVRGFLGETKYNKNINETLENSHNSFFMFNNGVTITAESIECKKINSGIKYLFTISNFQIVNGGQTIRSVFNFLFESSTDADLLKLREAFVLVRLFKIDKGDDLKNSIAEFTNSQNAISDIDLKSIDPLQIQIEKYLAEFDILYSRKAGDLGLIEKVYNIRVSMERLAQILYSEIGYPDRASNQKARLFKDYYKTIFKDNDFSLEKCYSSIMKSEEIIKEYASLDYKYYDQKLFYVIFIEKNTSLKVSKIIPTLETLLDEYITENEISAARKLIQKGFKTHVIDKLNIQIELK